ncbi:hypothetical protein VB734_09970 [Synechococcus sp. BA-124 BA4]|uniref:hypothetical protein n=1 Tax=unclassified Synechococcus TaxID=2626047 RepID=UPI002AD2BBB4|nr:MULTISPECIES: hypothetical protein [unclassified Synechococcus]MEA5400364.1 hypothetical protein [Synechococcus sp. BA-124 BA4]
MALGLRPQDIDVEDRLDQSPQNQLGERLADELTQHPPPWAGASLRIQPVEIVLIEEVDQGVDTRPDLLSDELTTPGVDPDHELSQFLQLIPPPLTILLDQAGLSETDQLITYPFPGVCFILQHTVLDLLVGEGIRSADGRGSR